MTMNQVKKIKDCQDKETSHGRDQTLCLHNEEDSSQLYDGTNLPPCHITLLMHTISMLRNDIYAYLCIQFFSKKFTDDYLSTHLYGQEARKVFVQHPRYNIEVFLKRSKYGWAIMNRRWAKVAHAFNFLEGSIFAFCFNSFPDAIHVSIYRL